MGTAAKVQRNYQITLPAAVRKQAQIKVGDLMDFEVREDGILIKPLATVDRSQLWFWSKRWQEEERKVERDFRKGRVKASKGVKEFLAEMDKA
ncbi:MAG: AbrB/MazE/SpoVT family DNA-binding domain-containing protein [Nitrospirae bacterium]|nr:AbrB/MazE/SpoVT family DNA-binding domain-containing protein [Nitrospirota bacterium]